MMTIRRLVATVGLALWLSLALAGGARAGDQPVAIFHAFDQRFTDVEAFVCELANQGYSHVQLSPVQKSNPATNWWARYQPVDYSVIEGLGSESELKSLIQRAHGCNVKVIADVVFNHMADMPQYTDLNFPQIKSIGFHSRCNIDYGNRDSVINCWLGSLPDLDHGKANVMTVQKQHLKKLMGLGIDGFRFDAAKHMRPEVMQAYIDYINHESHGNAWNYLEVIEDSGTKAEDYDKIAAVTDFVLYGSMKDAFTLNGDLRSLRVPKAVDDARSVTFGRLHDNIRELNSAAINPYSDASDSFLATSFVLARESGTPLVFNGDNYAIPFIRTGVKFRQIMQQRKRAGALVKENVLAVIDSQTLLMMERGAEGFYIVNKAATKVDKKDLDVTLTNLEGCYRELRNNFIVSIERRNDNKKWVTRWGSSARGGIEVYPREALYFVRESWSQCQAR